MQMVELNNIDDHLLYLEGLQGRHLGMIDEVALQDQNFCVGQALRNMEVIPSLSFIPE